MAVARYVTCKDIINRAATEVGLTPIDDVFASTDPAFVQLRTLLTSCGQNLLESYEWETLRRQYLMTTMVGDYILTVGTVTAPPFNVGETLTGGTSGATGVIQEISGSKLGLGSITGTFVVGETVTATGTTAPVVDYRVNGEYDLPDDFDRMIDQTGWNRTNRVPLGGPLSAQQWQYLIGSDLVTYTIYATFRIMENKWNLFPQPPPSGQVIAYEYVSRNWIRDATDPLEFFDVAEANDDIVLYKPEVIVQYLRFKFLSAKGFNTTDASQAFAKAYGDATGGDKGAPVLNAGRGFRGIHLLDYYNIPDSNYGM